MDVLANVLGVAKLANSLVCQSELVTPWGLAIEAPSKTVVHLVRRGACWLWVEGDAAPTLLGPGDVVLVSRGLRHTLTDDPATPAEPWEEALGKMRVRLAQQPALAAEATQLLCAAYEFEAEGRHPLVGLLPRLIRLNLNDAERDPVHALVQLLLHESGRTLAGHDIVIPRLVDSLFVFIIRAWLESQPVGTAGWFGALRDPQIGRALGLIHDNPERPWTVANLAKAVALSRAAFARRFGELVGEPPLKYLTRWRMSLAAKILKTTGAPVDAVAIQVGYDSSTAFTKAFQRHLHVSPGRYRAAGRSAVAG
jgi:AraC-like DNA-binding protein